MKKSSILGNFFRFAPIMEIEGLKMSLIVQQKTTGFTPTPAQGDVAEEQAADSLLEGAAEIETVVEAGSFSEIEGAGNGQFQVGVTGRGRPFAVPIGQLQSISLPTLGMFASVQTFFDGTFAATFSSFIDSFLAVDLKTWGLAALAAGLITYASTQLLPRSHSIGQIKECVALRKFPGEIAEKAEKLLLAAYYEFGELNYIKEFVKDYGGPPAKFVEAIEAKLDLLRRGRAGEISQDDITALLPTEEGRRLWARYKGQGWQIAFVTTKDWKGPKYASGWVDEKNKTAALRLVFSREPLALTVVHEIKHLEQLELLSANQKRVEEEIRRILVNLTGATVPYLERTLGKMGMERADILAGAAHIEARKGISQSRVDGALTLLMELGAHQFEIDVYTKAVSKDPSMKNKIFDIMAMDPQQMFIALTEMTNQRVGLPDFVVSGFENITFEDILARAQAATIADIDRAPKIREAVSPSWQSADEFLGELPRLVRLHLEKEERDPLYGKQLNPSEELIGLALEDPGYVDELIAFFSHPVISTDPERAGRYVRTKFKDLSYKFSNFEEQYLFTIRLLGAISEKTGGAPGLDAMIYFLERGGIKNDYLFGTITRALLQMKAPDKAKRLIAALARSPHFYIVKKNPNAMHDINHFMNEVRKDAETERPDVATLDRLLEEWCLHWMNSARASDDYHQSFNMLISTGASSLGAEYFGSIGEERLADKYRLLKKEAVERMYSGARGAPSS